jgi:hypothetical protein
MSDTETAAAGAPGAGESPIDVARLGGKGPVAYRLYEPRDDRVA